MHNKNPDIYVYWTSRHAGRSKDIKTDKQKSYMQAERSSSQADRQTDRQTDRQAGRETGKQAFTTNRLTVSIYFNHRQIDRPCHTHE